MQKIKKIVFCLIFGAFGLCCLSMAEAMTSDELIKEAKRYDNQAVFYEGELIGSVLNRGNFAWLNLYDGKNALSVWIQRSQVTGDLAAGSYKQIGDRIAVIGIFHRACLEHGGALDIHVTNIKIVKLGEVVPEFLGSKKILLLFLFLGVFACLLIIYLLQKKHASR